jgi:tetratricopeptide (TPR) repeat protein
MSKSLKAALVFLILSALLIVYGIVASVFSPTFAQNSLGWGFLVLFLLMLSAMCFLWWSIPKIGAWLSGSPPSPPQESGSPPHETVEEHFEHGNNLFSEEHYEQAIIEYTNAIKLDPKFAGAYYNRGVTYGKKEQYELAIADYSEAIKVYPKHADAYYSQGLTYGKKGQYDLAIADFNKVIEFSSKNANAYYNRGLSYSKKGQYDLAIADLNIVLKLSTESLLTEQAQKLINELQEK